MTSEASTKGRVFRIAFFVASWCCMAFMFMTLIMLAGQTREWARVFDFELTPLTYITSHFGFLAIVGIIVLAGLIKEPFIASHERSIAANGVFLLIIASLLAFSVLAFALTFHEIGFTLGG